MPAPLLPAVVIEPTGPHRSTLIWLHGLGADGHDFEPVAVQLQLPEALGVRFVLPHAPQRAVTINGGYLMRAWYDIAAPDLSIVPDVRGIRASEMAVMQWIEKETEEGIAPERIILAGFSQGGVVALETAARHQNRVGGVIALSCYVALPDELPAALRPLPVFMGHGEQDPVVPYSLGLASRNLLEAKGYALDWHAYAMPHSVCRDEVLAIRAWLLQRLGPV